MSKVNKFWDGQGAAVSAMWDGKTFHSYISNSGYISRFSTKTPQSLAGEAPVDYTGEVSGEVYVTPFGDGDVFEITTDSGTIIVDTVRVTSGMLVVLKTEQL